MQLARAAGAIVYGTSRTAEKLEQVRALGLDETITVGDTPQEFVERVRKLTAERRRRGHSRSGWGRLFPANLQALATRGRIICVGTMGGRKSEIDLVSSCGSGSRLSARRCARDRSQKRRRPRVGLPLMSCRLSLVVVVRPIVDRVYPVGEVRTAHEYLESNRSCGKVVLDFSL